MNKKKIKNVREQHKKQSTRKQNFKLPQKLNIEKK